MKTHFKPTETLKYTFFTTCHPPGSKKGFVKGEARRLLRTNSSDKTFEESITTFQKHLIERGYPQNFINNNLGSEISRKDTSPPPTKQNKETNLALRNTIPPSSSKSEGNTNEGVVANTATTIASKLSRRRPYHYTERGHHSKTYSKRAKL